MPAHEYTSCGRTEAIAAIVCSGGDRHKKFARLFRSRLRRHEAEDKDSHGGIRLTGVGYL